MDLQEHLLHDVVGVGVVADAAPDEAAQPVVELAPEVFRIADGPRHSAAAGLLDYRQPHRPVVSVVPQHSAFSEGSQQEALASGLQHADASFTSRPWLAAGFRSFVFVAAIHASSVRPGSRSGAALPL
jgi:hypothetical protein